MDYSANQSVGRDLTGIIPDPNAQVTLDCRKPLQRIRYSPAVIVAAEKVPMIALLLKGRAIPLASMRQGSGPKDAPPLARFGRYELVDSYTAT